MTRHDGDTERTFAALPPAHGRGFAQTWHSTQVTSR